MRSINLTADHIGYTVEKEEDMSKTAQGYEMIEAKEVLENLEVKKKKVIYSDTFFNITKEEQQRIYEYCLIHCTIEAVKDNLKQIRYAVSKQYFGI